jgi:hypothetical protein
MAQRPSMAALSTRAFDSFGSSSMTPQPIITEQDKQRARAKRTVMVLALVATTIYVAFVLHAMLSR